MTGSGSAKALCVLGAACAVVAWLSSLFGSSVRSYECQVATVVAASLSAASFLISALLAFSDRAGLTGGARDVMRLAVAKKDRNFGNARYVRNLFENAIQRQAVRLSTVAPLTAETLAELTLHDLGFAYDD